VKAAPASAAPAGRPPGALGYVRRLARSSRSNFYYAFLILPRAQRRAILAVYGFCRAADDAVDDAPDLASAERAVEFWRAEIARGLAGEAQHPIAVRAGEAAREFELPRELFEDVLRGVEMDIRPRRFARWEDLAGYCDLVAGAVGRLSVRIFGWVDPSADRYAGDLGAALQLTNILRDLGPDARAGRFYLPLEDLERYGVSERDVADGSPAALPLLQFEAERARALFASARRIGRERPREVCAAEAMAAIYRNLLERVVRAGFPVAGPPVRVPRPVKALLAGSCWMRGRFAGGARS